MKIVIDIPNWLYNAIKECNEPHYSKSLGDAVRDGTPLKQEPKTKWISAKEKLPKKSGNYLVTIQSFGHHTFMMVISFATNLYLIDKYDFKGMKRAGWYNYDSECGYYEMDNVIAWQPLPELYKETEG